MELRFTPDQEMLLANMAIQSGTDTECFVRSIVLRSISQVTSNNNKGNIAEELRNLRAQIKPDPEGWTTRDYVKHGRK